MGFTREQQLAIDLDNSNIIVSAGAGSGKTAVLTERVIRKLKQGVDIDHLLVLTFTNEAASEMKSRIRDSITKNNLTKQLDLLDSAYITTFDSYALSLVKKYNYLINVSDNLKIIDSNIITIYKNKILDNIFEDMYGDIKFNKLIDDFCLKDDISIKKFITLVSNKLDLLVDKDSYITNYFTNFYHEDRLKEDLNNYNLIIKDKIKELIIIYNEFIDYINDDLINKLDEYFKPLNNGTNYNDYVLFVSKEKPRFTKVDENGSRIKEELNNKIDEIKDMLRFKDENDIINSLKKTEDYVKVVLDIVIKLDKEVAKYKEKYQIYEFNDISHMAIKIVKENISVREELKEYFNEIMIDEYQDTSSIQEEFIHYIANNNVYMVGDIKQSIYRFRNANPYIFQEKYNKYSKHNGGIKIDLIKNFRSRKETLFNINEIFNLIMDDEIGNANYLKEHNMVYGNTLYDLEDTKVNNSLEIYNYEYDKEDEYTKEEKELFIVSEDINNKIKNKYQVFDKKTGKLRDIKYSDICIITDRNKYLSTYRKILEYHAIPSVIYMDEELTQDMVVLVIKNLIDLVWHAKNKNYDNKFRYVFASVARSFLFSIDDNMIYHILNDKDYFNNEIIKLCDEIDINKPIINIINDIINTFNVYEKLINLSDIEANIIKISNLIDIASSTSSLNYSIPDFINYLDEAINNDLSVKYSLNSSSGDAVKIMNIHKSKGLEFSLCYFTGMHNKITIKDISSKYLISEKYGIIMPYKEDDELKDTITREIYTDNFFKEEVSEKLRLFYVALTRCREKMIIVTSLSKENNGYNYLVPYIKRIKYRSFLDILNSVSVIDKYIVNKSANYTHDYLKIKLKDINQCNSTKIIDNRRINLNYELLENKHFSKVQNKLITSEESRKMEYGTKIHEIFEYSDFFNPDNEYVKKLVNLIPNSFINVYHEYEISYQEDDKKYFGVIDLIIEYESELYIIDYKLKNIDDSEYQKQLSGYKKYVESISDKLVKTYLYSIIDNELREVK